MTMTFFRSLKFGMKRCINGIEVAAQQHRGEEPEESYVGDARCRQHAEPQADREGQRQSRVPARSR